MYTTYNKILLIAMLIVMSLLSACNTDKFGDNGTYETCTDITSCVTTSPQRYVDSPLVETLNQWNDALK